MRKIIILVLFLLIPQFSHAVVIGNIFDPLCLFSWRDGCKDDVNINYNSNVNSPGGVIVNNADPYYYYEPYYPTYPTQPLPRPPEPRPNPTPTMYDLYVTCSPDDSSVEVDDTVRWSANVSGGTGSYTYSWNGSNGLSGSNQSETIRYGSTGTKDASVTVRSGNQTVTRSCSSVYVYERSNYNYHYYDNYNYNYNNYDYYSYNQPYVSCYPDVIYTTSGNTVVWRAYPSGGDGYYSYSWSGTDNLYGGGQYVTASYTRSGIKSAWVTVRSANRSASASCGSVTVSGITPVTGGYLYATCSPSMQNAKTGNVLTWSVYPTGGNGYYTYTWTGSDGFTGAQKSVATSYNTTGSKSAQVTVYSAGQVRTISCGDVNVTAATAIKKPTVKKPTVTPEPPTTQVPLKTPNQAFAEVPWNLVLLIMIAVLFGTVMYLIGSNKKG